MGRCCSWPSVTLPLSAVGNMPPSVVSKLAPSGTRVPELIVCPSTVAIQPATPFRTRSGLLRSQPEQWLRLARRHLWPVLPVGQDPVQYRPPHECLSVPSEHRVHVPEIHRLLLVRQALNGDRRDVTARGKLRRGICARTEAVVGVGAPGGPTPGAPGHSLPWRNRTRGRPR